MWRRLHPIAGIVALLTIAIFWVSTVISELSGSEHAVIAVKQVIPWGLLLLVPALALTGASGFILGRGDASALIASKRRRMPIIAANGILVLVPCALTLALMTRDGGLDTWFYTVQVIELVAGAVNVTLMGLNARDGMLLTGRIAQRHRPSSSAPQ